MGRPAPAEPRLVNCKWWKRGHCRRADSCYFRHDPCLLGVDQKPAAAAAADGEGDDALQNTRGLISQPAQPHDPTKELEYCAICLEVPKVYGLLLHCDHVYCLVCIRQWRSSKKADRNDHDDGYSTPNANGIWGSKMIKSCPLCRKPSKYIIPSAVFPTPLPATDNASKGTVEGEAAPNRSSGKAHAAAPNPLKDSIIAEYTRSMKRIPCRYFEAAVKNWETKAKRATERGKEEPPFRPVCFFENKCHYAHTHPRTKRPYIFEKQHIAEMHRKRLKRKGASRRWGGMDDSLLFLSELRTEFIDHHLSNEVDGEGYPFDSPFLSDDEYYWEDLPPIDSPPLSREMRISMGYTAFVNEYVL
ncbi:putative RING-type E3 ubiquitin transferase [Microsporum canis]